MSYAQCNFSCVKLKKWYAEALFRQPNSGGGTQIGHFSNPHRVACLWADSNSGSVQTGHAWSTRAKCRGDPFLTSAPSRSRCRCPRRSSAIGIRASFSSIPQIFEVCLGWWPEVEVVALVNPLPPSPQLAIKRFTVHSDTQGLVQRPLPQACLTWIFSGNFFLARSKKNTPPTNPEDCCFGIF